MVDITADTVLTTTATAVGASRTESAVSWASIIGGAVAAAAISTILLALGSGVGLSAISAWPGSGMTAAEFGMTGAVWLVVTQSLPRDWAAICPGACGPNRSAFIPTRCSSAIPPTAFSPGRSRTLIGVALLAAAVTWAATETARNASVVAAGAAGGISQGVRQQGTQGSRRGFPRLSDRYVIPLRQSIERDATRSSRRDHPASDGRSPQRRRARRGQDLSGAAVVSARTGLSQADAEARVNAVLDKAKATMASARQQADAARKAASKCVLLHGLRPGDRRLRRGDRRRAGRPSPRPVLIEADAIAPLIGHKSNPTLSR